MSNYRTSIFQINREFRLVLFTIGELPNTSWLWALWEKPIFVHSLAQYWLNERLYRALSMGSVENTLHSSFQWFTASVAIFMIFTHFKCLLYMLRVETSNGFNKLQWNIVENLVFAFGIFAICKTLRSYYKFILEHRKSKNSEEWQPFLFTHLIRKMFVINPWEDKCVMNVNENKSVVSQNFIRWTRAHSPNKRSTNLMNIIDNNSTDVHERVHLTCRHTNNIIISFEIVFVAKWSCLLHSDKFLFLVLLHSILFIEW